MPRWLTFLIFLSVATTIVAGVHYYIYRRLVVAPSLPGHWGGVARTAIVALGLAIPLSFFVVRLVDNSISRYVVYPVYVWLGFMLLFLVVLLATDLVRVVVWVATRLSGQTELLSAPERRLFFSRVLAGTAAGTVLTAAGTGLARGLGKLVVKEVEVKLPHLPRALDGFTIVQLTDLHLGPMRHRGWMTEVVERTNALAPDLVAITGDLVDGSIEQLAGDVEPLRSLQAPHGTFFVTGNHEYFVDAVGWVKHLSGLGLRVLSNERVTIERGGAAFDLAGVEDYQGRAMGRGTDVSGALRGRDPERALVLLAHQPRVIDEAARHDVGLVLAGHTHGGQIWPWGYFVYLQQPYVSGLHHHGGTQIYVSHGTGFWGPPMRLGSTAEITRVTLRA